MLFKLRTVPRLAKRPCAGLQVGVCFNSLPPNVTFLLGPLYTKYAPKEREMVMRCKKANKEESEDEWEEE